MNDLKPNRELLRTSDVTASGSHFLKDFASCAQKGARSHFYQHPNMLAEEGFSYGLQGFHTPASLLSGSALHSGLEAWYASRIRDGEDTGEANLDLAISTADTEWANRSAELHPSDDPTTLISATRALLERYHDHFNRGGPLSDYPNLKVLVDDEGTPWIERHFEIPLTPEISYTARIDLVVTYNGFLCVMDHKSTKASFLSQLLSTAELEAQFTGQLLCLNHEAPELPISGILINALVKDARKGPPFQRAIIKRTQEQLDLYRLHTINLFERIKWWRESFEELLASGMEYEKAFQIAFPMDGLRHGGCYAYYRKCQFWDFCSTPKMAERQVALTMRPKRKIINELLEQEI